MAGILLFRNNHDLPRIVSIWEMTENTAKKSAKAVCNLASSYERNTLYLSRRGIGMTNYPI